MATGLRYDGTRLLFALFLATALYFFAIPAAWPPPAVSVDIPEILKAGEDLTVRLTVKAWHPNFRVRQVSLTVDGIGSTAYSSKKLFVPVNLLEVERTTEWSVGFGERSTWPRKRRFQLKVPTGKMYRSGTLGQGLLSGTIDVTVDYTRVTPRAGYPALKSERSLPYTLRIGS